MKRTCLVTVILIAGFVSSVNAQLTEETTYRVKDAFQKNQADTVIQLLSDHYPKDSAIYPAGYFLGWAYGEKYQFQKSITILEEIMKGDTSYIHVANLLAEQYLKTGQTEKAVHLYEGLFRHDSSNIHIANKLAEIYYDLKRYSHAAAIYQKLANQDSLNYYYQKKLGDCYFRYQQNKKALNAFWTAHTLNPNDLSVYTRLANLYVREKAYSETIQIVRKGLKKDSTVGDFYSLLGFANFRMKHYDSAFIFFAKAIELGDSTKFNYKYAGLSRYDSQDFKKAARFLLLAFEKDSTDVQVVFYLGSAMGRGGREKEGLDYLFKAYDLIQPDKESLLDINKELARTYNMLEKPKQALFYYKQAYKVKPEPELAFQMAYIYDHSLANKKMALNYYEGFLTMLPEKDTLEGNNMIEQGFQISLAEIASQRIKAIKEEFFWKGENPDSTGLK